MRQEKRIIRHHDTARIRSVCAANGIPKTTQALDNKKQTMEPFRFPIGSRKAIVPCVAEIILKQKNYPPSQSGKAISQRSAVESV